MSNNLSVKESMVGLRPQNMTELIQLSEIMAGSQLVPKDYRGKSGDTLIAMLMGLELGLNPIQSLQNIAVINGKPSIYGDALLALMQNHRAFGGITETFDDAVMTASCTVWRKGGERHTQTFSQADAVKAGLWGKEGPWTQYPKRMLQWRARGFAIRNQFADALAGLITREEAMDMTGDEPRDITPEPAKIAYYPADQFDKNFESWKAVIQAGKKSAQQIIAMVQSKGVLNTEQQKAIKDCEILEGE